MRQATAVFNILSRRRGGRALTTALAILLPFVITVRSIDTQAGTRTQGTRTQGTRTQGTRTQGTRTQGTRTQGTRTQGVRTHGTRTQGTRTQGRGLAVDSNTRRPLQGERFTATLTVPKYSNPLPIEISDFRGEVALGRVWRASTGWNDIEFHASDLVGMRWTQKICDQDTGCMLSYRISNAKMDRSRNTMPRHGENSDVWLYTVEYTENLEQNDWQPVCESSDGSDAGGMFVNGQWGSDGTWSRHGYTFSCASGVIAKCVRGWGYKPWKTLHTASGQKVSLKPLHRACVRAARAEYCGDGVSYSRDGTRVDMLDVYNFNTREVGTGFYREAGFDPNGAQWMARKRWPTPGQDNLPHIELPTCKRPRYAPGTGHDRALIQVWSNPHLTQKATM